MSATSPGKPAKPVAERDPIVHEVQAGVAGFDAVLAYGLVAPAGTPRFIIDKLNAALQAALASDEVKKQLELDGTEILPSTPQEYADFIDKDEKKWSELVKASGVEPE